MGYLYGETGPYDFCATLQAPLHSQSVVKLQALLPMQCKCMLQVATLS